MKCQDGSIASGGYAELPARWNRGGVVYVELRTKRDVRRSRRAVRSARISGRSAHDLERWFFRGDIEQVIRLLSISAISATAAIR